MSATKYDRPKRTAEQINIWWSPTRKEWMTCAWLPLSEPHKPTVVYSREREYHPTIELAIEFVKNNYTGTMK